MVRPEDFQTANPPVRIMGPECEFHVQPIPIEQWDRNFRRPTMRDYIGEKAVKAAGYNAITIVHDRNYAEDSFHTWMGTGDLVYPDMTFAEFGGRESGGPKANAVIDYEGMNKITKIIDASGQPHDGIFRRAGSAYQQKVSSGYHLNLLYPKAALREWFGGESEFGTISLLTSALATQAWGWSGMITSEAHGWEWSQKADGLGKSFSTSKDDRTGQGMKPLIMLRHVDINGDVDVNPLPEWCRFELRGIDAPMFKAGIYLNGAFASLVLRLGEHPDIAGDIVKRTALQEPIKDMQALSRSKRLDQLLTLQNGKQVYADVVQERLVAKFEELANRIDLPEDEKAAIPHIKAAVAAQRKYRETGDLEDLATYCDAARKLKHLQRKHDDISGRNKQAVQIDLKYHQVGMEGSRILPGIGLLLAQRVYFDIDELLVAQTFSEELLKNGDPYSRAPQRGGFISGHAQDNRPDHMDWSGAIRGPLREPDYMHDWSDPYAVNNLFRV